MPEEEKEEIRVKVPAEVKQGLIDMSNGHGAAAAITALYYNAIQTGYAPFGINENLKKEK